MFNTGAMPSLADIAAVTGNKNDGCCVTAAVQNTSAQAIEVQNSNLIAVREA